MILSTSAGDIEGNLGKSGRQPKGTQEKMLRVTSKLPLRARTIRRCSSTWNWSKESKEVGDGGEMWEIVCRRAAEEFSVMSIISII